MKKLLLNEASLASCAKIFVAKEVVAITILVLLSARLVFAQRVDTSTNKARQTTYDLYMHKRKVQNTNGTVLLGSGFIMMAVGLARIANGSTGSFITGVHVPQDGVVFLAAGTGAMLISVPFFISAGSNKRKARLSLKTNSVAFGGSGAGNFNYMALALKVHF